MKKILRRLLLLLVAVTLLMSLLSACENNTGKEAGKQQTDLDIPEKQLNEATLTFYFMYFGNGNGEKPDTRLVLDEIERRTRQSLNVKLDFRWFDPRNYSSKIRTMFSSGEPIDAFFCGRPDPNLFDIKEMTQNGELKDITKLFPKYAPSLSQKYTNDQLACAKIDGKLVAIPSLYPMPYCTHVLVREDLREKYGIPVIKTMDDYERYLAAVKENETDIIPGKICGITLELFPQMYDYAVLDYFKRLVYKWDDPQMTVMAWEQTPGFLDTVQRITSWYDKGYLHIDNGRDLWGIFRTMMLNGKLASCMLPAAISIGEPIEAIVYKINNDLKINSGQGEVNAYALYPEKKVQVLSPIGDIWATGSIAFNAASSNTERALMFLDWIQQSQENYDLFMYGIKDKHYILKDDQYAMPEGMTANENLYFGWTGRNAFRSITLERLPYGFPKFIKDDYIEYMGNNTRYAPHEGFYPDYSSVALTAAGRDHDFFYSYDSPIITGQIKLSDIEEAIKESKKSDINELVRVVQEQLSTWIANKDR